MVPRIRLYTRPGCGLCEEVRAALEPWVRRGRVELEVVDLEPGSEVEARYGAVIPVLEHEGRPFAKGRFDVAEALQRLDRRLRP